MGLLSRITRTSANEQQEEVFSSVVGSRSDSGAITASDGSLLGPFNAMVMSPVIGQKISELGAAIRFKSSLEPRLLELAITTVGAHWKSNFEFWAHSRLAAKAGIAAEIIDALAGGETPAFANADEALVHSYVTELLTTGSVTTDAHNAAVELLGEPSVADLVHTVGYYCLISLSLNAFHVPVPEGVDAPFG
jgi:4-carboxymuconolactone decarboxylase